MKKSLREQMMDMMEKKSVHEKKEKDYSGKDFMKKLLAKKLKKIKAK